MKLKEIEEGDVDWNHLVQDVDRFWDDVNALNESSIRVKGEEILVINWATLASQEGH
jgi:hypothetical protein